MADLITRATLDEYKARYSNWGRWGAEDQIGTLNFVTPECVTAAAGLVEAGKRISMGLNFDQRGPQTGGGRSNPIHWMAFDGGDMRAGLGERVGLQWADDWVTMPLQCGTQWDALSHIFYDGEMYNGRPAEECMSTGARRNGIEHTKSEMAGRGVLLDVARSEGVDFLEDGLEITEAMLDRTAAAQGVEIRSGDFIIVRTGQMEKCLDRGDWGEYAGGDAPGLAFETIDWIHRHELAAVATDTWGAEVRPNRTEGIMQPWHWIAIPVMGLSVGEIFYLRDIADDCADDGRYEFLFVAPSLPVTGAVGSPINPMAIK